MIKPIDKSETKKENSIIFENNLKRDLKQDKRKRVDSVIEEIAMQETTVEETAIEESVIEADHLIVRSKVRELVKDCSISRDFFDELERSVKEMILKAKQRARANKRNTLMPRDL